MPSSWTHAMTAVAIGAALVPMQPPRRTWTVLTMCAVIPDIDAIGRPFGSGDIAFLGGHRGFTHSITCVLALSLAAFAFLRRDTAHSGGGVRLWVALAVAIAAHPALDTFAAYGQGIAFLAPWSDQRFPLRWRPLHGVASDTGLFVLAFLVARIIFRARGIGLPRLLSLAPGTRRT